MKIKNKIIKNIKNPSILLGFFGQPQKLSYFIKHSHAQQGSASNAGQ
jgi:hypothetical protein